MFLSLKDIFGLSFSCCIFQKDLIFQLDCSCFTIQGKPLIEYFGIEIAIPPIALEMKPLFVCLILLPAPLYLSLNIINVWVGYCTTGNLMGQQFNSTIFNRKKLLGHEILGGHHGLTLFFLTHCLFLGGQPLVTCVCFL